MNHYKRVKTTMGHRFTMRMPDCEVAERLAFKLVLTIVPFVTAAAMALVFFKGW